jgi:hypothetical protein
MNRAHFRAETQAGRVSAQKNSSKKNFYGLYERLKCWMNH